MLTKNTTYPTKLTIHTLTETFAIVTGVIMDPDLNFDTHIDTMTSKANRILGTLKSLNMMEMKLLL